MDGSLGGRFGKVIAAGACCTDCMDCADGVTWISGGAATTGAGADGTGATGADDEGDGDADAGDWVKLDAGTDNTGVRLVTGGKLGRGSEF